MPASRSASSAAQLCLVQESIPQFFFFVVVFFKRATSSTVIQSEGLTHWLLFTDKFFTRAFLRQGLVYYYHCEICHSKLALLYEVMAWSGRAGPDPQELGADYT